TTTSGRRSRTHSAPTIIAPSRITAVPTRSISSGNPTGHLAPGSAAAPSYITRALASGAGSTRSQPGQVRCDIRSLPLSDAGPLAPGVRDPDHHAGRRPVPDARTLRLYDPREERRSGYQGRRPDVPAAGQAGTGPDSARRQARCRA